MRPSGHHDTEGPRYPHRRGIQPRTNGWVAWVHEIDNEKGYKICGRKNRLDEPCQFRSAGPDPALDYGRRPCRYHGDKSYKGVGAPGWKDGSKSRYALRGRLASSYERELGDMDYISLREDIAVLKALLDEEITTLDDPTPCPQPLHLEEPCPQPLNRADFDAREVEERRLLIEAWREREGERQEAIGEWYQARAVAYRRVRELFHDKQKLTRTEIHRVKLASDTLSGQQVRVFGQVVLDTTRTHVLTLVEEARQSVHHELHQLGERATAADLARALDVVLGPALALATMHQIQMEVTRTIEAARGENMGAELEMELLGAG